MYECRCDERLKSNTKGDVVVLKQIVVYYEVMNRELK